MSPILGDDSTKSPSSDPDHSNNTLDSRIASVARARKLDMAAPETYLDASNTAKLESTSSPSANKLKYFVDEIPSNIPVPLI